MQEMLDVVFRKEMTPIASSTPYQGGVAFHLNRHRGERNGRRHQFHHNGVAGEPPHGPSPWRCWHKPKQTVAITSHHGAANTPQRRFTKPHQKPKPGRCHVNHFANTDTARLAGHAATVMAGRARSLWPPSHAGRHREGGPSKPRPPVPPPDRSSRGTAAAPRPCTPAPTSCPSREHCRHCTPTARHHEWLLQPCSSGHPGL